jgi:hypothetical protein
MMMKGGEPEPADESYAARVQRTTARDAPDSGNVK